MRIQRDIRPYVELYDDNELFKSFGFRIVLLQLHVKTDGWAIVTVEWDTDENDNKYKVKHATDGGSMHSFSDTNCRLNFPQLTFRYKNVDFDSCASMDVGIEAKRFGRKLQYDAAYFENIKFGAAVYFQPKNWHKVKSERLFEWIDENSCFAPAKP
jgi:hypothetical protein